MKTCGCGVWRAFGVHALCVCAHKVKMPAGKKSQNNMQPKYTLGYLRGFTAATPTPYRKLLRLRSQLGDLGSTLEKRFDIELKKRFRRIALGECE